MSNDGYTIQYIKSNGTVGTSSDVHPSFIVTNTASRTWRLRPAGSEDSVKVYQLFSNGSFTFNLTYTVTSTGGGTVYYRIDSTSPAGNNPNFYYLIPSNVGLH